MVLVKGISLSLLEVLVIPFECNMAISAGAKVGDETSEIAAQDSEVAEEAMSLRNRRETQAIHAGCHCGKERSYLLHAAKFRR